MPGDGPALDPGEGALFGLLRGLLLLPPAAVALMYGHRGTGKSSIGAAALYDEDGDPEDGERPWIATSEMSPALWRTYARRVGVRLMNISKPRRHELEDGTARVELGIPTAYRPRGLLVDSLHGIGGDPVVALAAVREYCSATSCRAIVTAQVTEEGRPRGSETIPHDCDAVIRLENGEITIEKSRFSPLGSRLYKLGAAGGKLPEWERYYSIEGSFPRYRLRPWPPESGGAGRFAGLLVASAATPPSERTLPPAPLAVGALDGGNLYTTGRWIEPVDSTERIRFALQHGIPYWTAGGRLYVPEDLASLPGGMAGGGASVPGASSAAAIGDADAGDDDEPDDDDPDTDDDTDDDEE